MRAALLAFALTVCGAGAAAAQDIAPALFVVRDQDSTMYLFGTIHALPEGTPWSNPDVLAALEEADEVWTETNFYDEELQVQYAADLAAAVAVPAETPLTSLLSPEKVTRLMMMGKYYGMTRAELDRFEPWAAALMMMGLGGDGATAEAGVDQQVINAATTAGLRRNWLEDSSIADMQALPHAVQIELLSWILDAPSGAPGELLWAQGEIETLFEADIAPMRAAYPNLYGWIIVQRNAAWMEKLSAEMAGAGVDFVAVGAAHLAGPDSLNAMFAARGYTVERVGE